MNCTSRLMKKVFSYVKEKHKSTLQKQNAILVPLASYIHTIVTEVSDQGRVFHQPASRMVVRHAGLALLVFGALALANSPGARAADAAGEIATAAQHAGYAADAAAIGMAHAHLQHTINCLVGPNGSGYDANALNPCKDMGSGAIPDTQDASKAAALKSAVVLAQQGLKSDDLDAAKKSGAQAAAEIKKAQ